MKREYRKIAIRRDRDKLVSDRAQVLQLCDGSRTLAEAAKQTGREHDEFYADVLALRRRGHKVPLRPRSSSGGKIVYRFFDADGVLLYVGCSTNLAARMVAHSNQKDWWSIVAKAEFQHFADSLEGYRAEQEAIRTERPLYNVQGQAPTPATGASA